MSAFTEPVVAWRGSTDPNAPLIVLLHGRGSNEARPEARDDAGAGLLKTWGMSS